jgi:hypothetical protein
VQNDSWAIGVEKTIRSIGPAGCSHAAKSAWTKKAAARLASLLELGDPDGKVAIAYRIKARLRDFYNTYD